MDHPLAAYRQERILEPPASPKSGPIAPLTAPVIPVN